MLQEFSEIALPKTTNTFLDFLAQQFPAPIHMAEDRFARLDSVNSVLSVVYTYEAESRSVIRELHSRALEPQ